MVARMVWRHLICPHILCGHTRDWFSWDSMGVSRCLHCERPMPEPALPPRRKL